MPKDITRLQPIEVMYVREYDHPSGEAFEELEAVVGLKGRRFYGMYDEGAGRYWACVQRREKDDPATLGLETRSIAGGLYATERLRGSYESLVPLIAPTFDAMAARHAADPCRPSVEYYRRHNEFVLYLPILEPDARQRDR